MPNSNLEIINKVHSELTDKVDELKGIIELRLNSHGDTCESSQRHCLLNALGYFEQNVNGLIIADLK